MHVLFIPAAVASHHYPMVPLAWAFRTAGHAVCVAGQPPVVQPIISSGLTALEVGASYDLMAGLRDAGELLRREVPADAAQMLSLPPAVQRRYAELRLGPHVRAARAMADELIEFGETWGPDLVVSDPVTMVAPLVAGVLGVPLVHHLFGPLPESIGRFPGFGAALDQWPDALLELFEHYGAEPRPGPGACVVDPCPPSLQTRTSPRSLSVRYLSYNGSAPVPDWLRRPAGRPRICVSWTTARTLGDGTGEHPLASLLVGLSKLDAEIVVAVRAADRARLDAVPVGVRLVEDLPLSLVLPSCAAAVNHGGAGTVLTTACHGVPQVVLPQAPGQTVNGEQVAAVGAGISFGSEPVTDERVVDAVAELLDGGAATAAAHRIRAENLDLPAPSQVLDRIQEFAWQGGKEW